MRRNSGARRTSSSPSEPRPGRTFSSARCSPSNCSGRRPSLRTTPIIGKVRGVRIAIALLALPLLAGASAPMQPGGPSLNGELRQARAEQAAAEKEAARLEQVAAKAQGELRRLRAEQAASAQAIDAGEARITAADVQLRLASAYVAEHRQQLAEQERPVS